MSKHIVTFILFTALFGCSQVENSPKPKPIEQNSIKEEPKHSSSASSDFVPEHLRLSHIEVVPH